MNILIAGASGFIGSELVKTLSLTHKITVLGRNKKKLKKKLPQAHKYHDWNELESVNATRFDAIINLCGENIAASRWTKKIKKNLINSRIKTNGTLINWLIRQKAKPHFICANAIGIYGVQENGDMDAFDENSQIDIQNPKDFLSEICIKWEASLKSAIDFGMPVTTTRFGVVLMKNNGLLKKIYPSFFFGFGSIIGDGSQCLSWVHINDVIGAVNFILKHPELTGPFNVTSPRPVNQETFARTLAKAMHRPLFFKTPPFFVKLLFGEMGEFLLLKGQRVLPDRLQKVGYQFLLPNISDALSNECN